METEFLSCAATEDRANIIQQMSLSGELTLLGLIPSRAESLATWDNGNLDQRIAELKQPADSGMTSLMDSYGATLLKSREAMFALQATDNTIHGILEILTLNILLTLTGGSEGGLVADIGNVGT